MTRDPWADDWEDDWTKAARSTKTNSEIWNQANSESSTTPSADIPKVISTVNYRPQIKILRRDASQDEADDSANLKSDPRLTLDKAARETRYKEARERLFGTPDSSVELAASIRKNTPSRSGTSSPSATPISIIKPERQSKGPDHNGRGGFGGRGRGQTQHIHR